MAGIKKKPRNVYVYEDSDHGDIEIFSTLEKALAYVKKCWPNHEPEWKEQCEGCMRDLENEYVAIYTKEVK